MNYDPLDELLSCKELAARLKWSESYVEWMKRRGFQLVAGRTSLRVALRWLQVNPNPCARGKVMKCKAR